jgi:hypothetical protein
MSGKVKELIALIRQTIQPFFFLFYNRVKGEAGQAHI